MRAVAAKIQDEWAAAEAAADVARHDADALGQPEDPPAVLVGDHFEVLTLIEEPVDDGPSEDYNQWMAVEVIAAADGTGE